VLFLRDRGISIAARAVGAVSVVLAAAVGLAAYLPWRAGPLGTALSFDLSQDALALTITVGIIGVVLGIFANRIVRARAYLAAVIVPFALSWPDYHGSYVVILGGYDWVARSPASRTERLSVEAIDAIQASGQIAVQFGAATLAAILGVTLGIALRALVRNRSVR
jgi:hypothetical protein